MKVPLLDLKKQFEKIKDEIMTTIEDVCDSQYFILGPRVAELEEQIAQYCGCKYAVGVSSGTDAILISLMSEGIGVGDRVITTPYTFFATAGAIARLGAVPIFVDIEKQTYNMDANKLARTIQSLDSMERSKLKAIVPIHLYGQCADMEPIMTIAKEFHLTVIEDAAQAIGAEYQFQNGSIKRAGSIGQYGCFSFFPSKNLGAFGDGGIVTTNDKARYDQLKILRVHGSDPKYYHKSIGGNFRLDALQAAVVMLKLKYLDEWTENRRQNANEYRRLINEMEIDGMILPLDREKRHIYNQFVIYVKDKRGALQTYLKEHGVGTEIYYPVPLHLQECFNYLKYQMGDLPISEDAAKNTLALPIYPELEREQIAYVVDIMRKFFKVS
ncbi:MAG: DegT/DnrJ/EryC1/StrS family aminotransferase [Deltaproteobacteria bacterium]|nr:DegT/DnrJ/EryC1/StrS family aminotransferase [Deltaproteobacteria bacterium]